MRNFNVTNNFNTAPPSGLPYGLPSSGTYQQGSPYPPGQQNPYPSQHIPNTYQQATYPPAGPYVGQPPPQQVPGYDTYPDQRGIPGYVTK